MTTTTTHRTPRQGVNRQTEPFWKWSVWSAPATRARMNSSMTPRQLGADGNVSGNAADTVVRLSLVMRSYRRGGMGWLSIFFAILAGPVAVQAADRWETLQAIHMIENPTNSVRVGRKGELGPYQFRPSTWKMHTKKPFALAADRDEADAVAVKHYDWIKRGLERSGIKATPYRIALAWNAGLQATLRNEAPPSSHQYAERVQAIAEDMRRQQLVGE